VDTVMRGETPTRKKADPIPEGTDTVRSSAVHHVMIYEAKKFGKKP
jgi:hypothetical protein